MSRPFQANQEDKDLVGETVTLDIVRRKGESWGIELCGEGPTEIRRVRAGGPADYAGLQAGDIVLQANGINCTKFAHQQVAQIIAESEKFLRLKVLPDESSDESEDEDEDEELDEKGQPKLKQPKAKSGSWWAEPKDAEAAKKEDKPDMTDFETFSENFDKIEKQHRKAGKAMVKGGKGGGGGSRRKKGGDDDSDEIDSDDEYVKFMKMKQKMIAKGKISESESDGAGSGDDDFAEFMRWKQQKRRAARRGMDDWDQDDWGKPSAQPVNRSSSSGYSSGGGQYAARQGIQGQNINYKGQQIEQGSFTITNDGIKKFDRTFELGAENTFKGDKAAVAGAFTGDHNVIWNENDEGQAAGDIKGVHNRVAAGIMHFNYEDENKEVAEEDKDKVVIYTTSLGVNRELVANCQRAIQIIRAYKVRYEERDIFNYEQHKEGLWERLGLDRNSKFPPMPRIYVDGIYIGGINELEATSDCGDLRIRLQHFPKFQDRRHCQYCNGCGRIHCRVCGGKKKVVKNDFTELQCSQCDKDGTVECKECIESVDLF